jgi:biopolymer transport protein ExbD
MAFGNLQPGDEQPMAEINTTPLVDVMLVLLIIFMVTAPLFTHAVRIDLPQAQSQPSAEKPETIALSIDAAGTIHWNDEAIAAAVLPDRLLQAAARTPQPELHLRADRDTRYQIIAMVMSQAQSAGLRKIGFVTDPTLPSRNLPASAGAGRSHLPPGEGLGVRETGASSGK